MESTQSCVNEVEDFVIFEYEGELLHGQVTVVKHNGCEIKSMAKSGANWKWPKIRNEMFYGKEDLKQKIKTPKQLK